MDASDRIKSLRQTLRGAGRPHMRLDPALELFMQAFDCIRSADGFPLAWRKAREGEQLVASLLQAVGDGGAFQVPFANERLSFRFDLLSDAA